MKVWFLPLWAGCLLAFCHAAFAQQAASRFAAPLESDVPDYSSNDKGRVNLALDSRLESSGDNLLPAPISAAPAPEPELPLWGQYVSPPVPPIATPPIAYDLIGPPRGVIQHSEQQDYHAVISDPDTVLAYDAQFGQAINIFRPDGMGPIGMFGDHTLPAGKMFISYKYLQNSFDQNYSGSHRTGPAAGFPFAPTRMLQDSQVALYEYGVTNDLTILAYLPFQHNEIDSQTAAGGSYKTGFTNPGDIRISALYVVNRGDRSQQHLNLGINIPVGFLEQQTQLGQAPSPSTTFPNLPYQVRTSSGTYDMLLGYTYRKQTDFWTWGGQVNAVIPTGKNTLGYEVGNQFEATAWLSRRWSERWSTSARLDSHVVGNFRGSDARLDPTLSPANQASSQGYQNLNGLLGVNYLFTRPGHRIEEQRLFLEAGVPFYQWVDGQQVGLSWILNAGWGMAF